MFSSRFSLLNSTVTKSSGATISIVAVGSGVKISVDISVATSVGETIVKSCVAGINAVVGKSIPVPSAGFGVSMTMVHELSTMASTQKMSKFIKKEGAVLRLKKGK